MSARTLPLPLTGRGKKLLDFNPILIIVLVSGPPRAQAPHPIPLSRRLMRARREAPASFKSGCGKTERRMRHLALHPLGLFEGHGREDGVPGAAKNTGDVA